VRGAPRVCSMVCVPSVAQEDRSRPSRERQVLVAERIRHVNRIKGLLFSQGVRDYEPVHRDRRVRLAELRTGDGRPLPERVRLQIVRELDRLELLRDQIKAVERERDEMLGMRPRRAGKRARGAAKAPANDEEAPSQEIVQEPAAALLRRLKVIGPEMAAVLCSEGFFRSFSNRRQVAAYAGLAPTPWRSGSIDREQGVSKAGNPRLRTSMIECSWFWLQHQKETDLARWFYDRVRAHPQARKTAIVALARKLLVALWKYATQGVLIAGAVMKPAA
jgi:transposase